MSKTETYDLVICGGGITGAGIARDAAERGLKVLLLEKRDLASGTSSKSSKLVHGGLRYLEHGEIKLVFEGTNERAVQMKRAPHLVRPIPFLVPVYKTHKPGFEVVNLGLWIYDALAMFRAPKLHRTYKGKRVKSLEPALQADGLAGALEYYDCLTDDARLVLENALDAQSLGATIRTYTKMLGIERNAEGKLNCVKARDTLTGERLEFQTRVLVVAAGPWTDQVLSTLKISYGRPLLRPSKGVHIVIDHKKLPVNRAITLFTSDKRVVFCLPWIERTVVGTTDTDFEGDPNEIAASREDVLYLCKHINAFFPKAELTLDDVISTWAGLRPLISSDASRASDVSREHEVFVHEDGVITIAGGKLTTYRRMAKEVTDRSIMFLEEKEFLGQREIQKKCRTKKRPLPGAQGLKGSGPKAIRTLIKRLKESFQLETRIAEHLAETYGQRVDSLLLRGRENPDLMKRLDPELPYLWVEVEHAFQVDLARTVEDILVRRIPLCLRSKQQGLDVVEEVATRMERHFGWPEEEKKRQLLSYEAYVNATRLFRHTPPNPAREEEVKGAPLQDITSH